MKFFSLLSAILVLLIAVFSLHFLQSNYLSNLRWSLSSQSSAVADLVVRNALIYTSDASIPFADSMAVRNGRILRIGNYSSVVQDLRRDGIKELDLEGKIVVPGFIDSHVHLIFGGLQMARVELRGANNKDEFVRRVQEAVRTKKQGAWVLGGGWNNDLWGGELPAASWIDDITPYNPVWLSRMDGHMGLANSVALRLAGITKYTEDPNGGAIMKTISGEPSGLLVDAAMKILLPWIPEVSVDERREAFVRASNLALMRGVTTVVDFGRYFPGSTLEQSWEDLSDVYLWANTSGKMMIRDLIIKKGRALSQWIYLGGVKAFADGSLGSNSALFYEVRTMVWNYQSNFINKPYADEPHNYGIQVTELESLFNMTMAADKFGLQVSIHAIGDKANDLILDVYKSVGSTNGMRDRRFRIEHAQHLAPGSATQFGEQGIVASVQPDHLLDDADSAIKKLGVDRAQKGSYLFRSLLASNAQLAFGSDWPVVDINPLGSITTAMKRIPPGWDNAWTSSECLTMNEALNAYTVSAARAAFLDSELGSLSPGKMADFVVLSADSWDDFAAGEVSSVGATYVGGLQAYP